MLILAGKLLLFSYFTLTGLKDIKAFNSYWQYHLYGVACYTLTWVHLRVLLSVMLF